MLLTISFVSLPFAIKNNTVRLENAWNRFNGKDLNEISMMKENKWYKRIKLSIYSTFKKIKEFLGESYSIEDAILLREIIRNNLDQGVILDFDGYDRVPSTFLINLFSDLIYKFGRDYIFKQVVVKNLSNYRDYSRVVLGTAFQQ